MREIFAFVRRYLARYWLWYLGGLLALIATNGLSVTIPLYVADGIDALGTPDGRPVVQRSALIVAAMGIAVIGVRTLSRVLFFTPGRLVEAEVKRDLFDTLMRQQPAFLRRWPTGDLVSRVSGDVNYLRLLGGFAALQVFNTVTALSLTGAQMVRLSPMLALWMVLPIAVALAFTQLFLQRLFGIMRRMQAQAADLSAHALASYKGIATIQAFTAEDSFTDQFDTLNRAYLDSTLKRSHIRTILGPTLSLAAAVNVAILLFVGGPMAIDGDLSVGQLVAFTTLVAYLTGPLRSLSFLFSLIKQGQAALERVDAIMDPEPERPDLPEPTPVSGTPPTIELRDLHFAYPDAPEEHVLHGISLTIPAGTTLGILGATGCGKSTLLRVLSRLYNPPPGTVFIDGTDIRDLDLNGWRERMSLVPQRAFLFSETVRDNILLGESESMLDELLQLTALKPDIEALPAGVETQVGESGVMLSGGQRQRVALARGLARENTVLLLDDVMSAVDHATEHELISSMQSEEGGTPPTTVIVAHRISALRHAEQILVLRGGRMAQLGTHEELVVVDGPYRDVWEHQSEEGS